MRECERATREQRDREHERERERKREKVIEAKKTRNIDNI